MGGVLCRPLRRHRCRDQSRKPWRERPRCARWNGPAPVRRVAHAMAVGVPCRLSACLWSVPESPRIRLTCARGSVHRDCPDDLVLFVPGNPGHRIALVPDAMSGTNAGAVETAIVARFWRPAEDATSCDHGRCAGHHAIHARSVLGTVQGSALRSDRAYARPAGLDGACAQIASWQLRDGRQCDDTLAGTILIVDRDASGANLFSSPVPLHTLRAGTSPRSAERRRPQGHDRQPTLTSARFCIEVALSAMSSAETRTARGIALRACVPRCTTEAWLHWLAIRENSTASVTHSLRAARPRIVRRPRGSASRSSMPATPPASAPLFPARWPQVSALERTNFETILQRLRDAATRQEGAMKPWLNVGEGAEYAGVSRDTIYTACERGAAARARRRQAIDSAEARMDRRVAGTTRARRPGTGSGRAPGRLDARWRLTASRRKEERMGLHKICKHKGRARDRCEHAWWGSFRGKRVSLANGRTARSRPRLKPTRHSTS